LGLPAVQRDLRMGDPGFAFHARDAEGAASEMFQEEAKTRLEHLPSTLIRLAALALPKEMRDDTAAEWQAELASVLRDRGGAERHRDNFATGSKNTLMGLSAVGTAVTGFGLGAQSSDVLHDRADCWCDTDLCPDEIGSHSLPKREAHFRSHLRAAAKADGR
jgi:hypothetical protein